MKNSIVAVTAAAALILTACGQTTAELDEPTAAAPAAPAESSAAEETEDDAAKEAEEEAAAKEAQEKAEAEKAAEEAKKQQEEDAKKYDGVAAFGESYTYQDGLTVTVSEPEPFTPGEWGFGGEGFAAHLAFTISVENGSDEPMDLSLATASVQSGTTEGDQVFDSENGFDGSPDTTLLPGRTSEWKVGFGVDDPEDLVFQFAPSWDHEAVHFVTE